MIPSGLREFQRFGFNHHADLLCTYRGYEVYDRLSPSFAAFLETLTAYHEAHVFRTIATALGNKLRAGIRGSPLNEGDALEAVHPVIR